MKRTLVPSERYNAETLQELPMELVSLCEQADRDMRALSESVTRSWSAMIEQVQTMQRQVESLRDRVTALFHRAAPVDRVVISERFQDDSIPAGTLYRDALHGGLTLMPLSFEDLRGVVAGLWVDRKQSLGIPGNNMVVREVRREPGKLPQVMLVGETDNRANLLLAFDSSVDTWFEWERVVVKLNQPLQELDRCMYFADESSPVRNVREVTGGYGWTVTVGYPGENQLVKSVPLCEFAEDVSGFEPATLALEIELTDVIDDMWLELVPYHIGGRGMVLERVAVSEDGIRWREIETRRYISPYRSDDVASAQRVHLSRARFVRLKLRSLGWYRPSQGFGHPFYAVRMKERRERKLLGFISLGSSTSRWVERRPTPEYAIGTLSVRDSQGVRFASRVMGGLLGLATGVSSKMMASAIGSLATSLGAFAAPVAFLVGALTLGSFLFSERVTREVEGTVSGMDVFSGWRSAIGVREIRLQRRTYHTAGEWVSPVYQLARPVDQLQLYVHDDVPDGCRVVYQVRVGDRWVDVDPHSINGRVISLSESVQEVQVRIQMSGQQSVTPVVYSFQLEGISS